MPVRALVEEHLRIPSDHTIIRILLDQEEPPPIQQLGLTNWDLARSLISPPDTSLLINPLAKEIVERAQLAIQGASKYNSCKLPQTPWWTPELSDLLY
jgi:hypothetical protein